MTPGEQARASQRTTASQRVARMLAMVPWIAANDGPTRDEICERFGLAPRELDADLAVITMVGVPPYTPDTLIEVTVDGDRVWLRFADVFARPLHLTPEQGLALLAAGQAARAIVDDEGAPLAAALAKVADVLGIDPDDAISVGLGESRPGVLEALRQAAGEHRRVRIDYYTHGRDDRTTREIDPHEIFASEGAWYVRAHCHLAGGERLFRVERVYEVEPTDRKFEPPPAQGEDGGVFVAAADAPRVTLDLAPAAHWVAETYPIEGDEMRVDGWRRVRLAVASRRWFERLLVRLGHDARIVASDDDDLVQAGRSAAGRILARYRPGP